MKKFLAEIEDNICSIILLAMTILTFVNVIARYLFKASMPFVEELTCLGLVILSLSGATVAAKRGAHLGLSVFTDLMPLRFQKALTVAGHIIGVIFGLIIAYFGYLMTNQEFILRQLTPGMQWPEWLFGMFVPISGLLITVRYTQLTIKELRTNSGEPGESEEREDAKQ